MQGHNNLEQVKGYPVPDGWKGWINGAYRLFSTEDEYKEACRERYGI